MAFGQKAEKLAEKHLRANGYTVIEGNYRCRDGEIDLIARDGGYLVFCEVKARRNRAYGTALEGVTPSKIRKIKKAAEHYLLKKKLSGVDCRFDIVTIDESSGGTKVELIKNAF
ncbi:MAG: YraN family protein [Nitrospinae bacterium]|nr:YraN family protein [Nitrospinota bacterium]